MGELHPVAMRVLRHRNLLIPGRKVCTDALRAKGAFPPRDRCASQRAFVLRGSTAALLLVAACGRQPAQADGGIVHVADLKGAHLSSCDDQACGSGHEPPLGGDHCPSWLPCRKYTEAQKRCAYVHNLEHGHAVLAHQDAEAPEPGLGCSP